MSNIFFSIIDVNVNLFNNDRDLHHNWAIQYLISEGFHEYVHENNFQNENEELILIHFNVRSVSANIYEFISYLETINLVFDIICTSETWLNENTHLLLKI